METCRTCKHRQRWMNEFSPKVTQVCELKKGRTQMGFRKIKVTDPACEKYEGEEQIWKLRSVRDGKIMVWTMMGDSIVTEKENGVL